MEIAIILIVSFIALNAAKEALRYKIGRLILSIVFMGLTYLTYHIHGLSWKTAVPAVISIILLLAAIFIATYPYEEPPVPPRPKDNTYWGENFKDVI